MIAGNKVEKSKPKKTEVKAEKPKPKKKAEKKS